MLENNLMKKEDDYEINERILHFSEINKNRFLINGKLKYLNSRYPDRLYKSEKNLSILKCCTVKRASPCNL